MRAALLLVFALTACAVRPAVAVELQTIASGGYARDDSGRQAVLVKTEDEYRRLWAEKIGSEPAPEADFGKGVVVLLLAGSRSTGGYAVVPESVDVSGGSAVIHAPVQRPGRGAIVTQALTSPYAVVFINSRDLESVQWPE
jgi:hypothetical protein